MKRSGTVTKMEKLLLGLTALFLCGLLVVYGCDRRQLRSAEIAVETEREAAQEEILAEARTLNLNTAAEEMQAYIEKISGAKLDITESKAVNKAVFGKDDLGNGTHDFIHK